MVQMRSVLKSLIIILDRTLGCSRLSRGDIEDAVTRLKPWSSDDGQVLFGGWARMALPITTFSIVEVAKPNIGEKQPSRVRADVSVNLSVKDNVKMEWENL